MSRVLWSDVEGEPVLRAAEDAGRGLDGLPEDVEIRIDISDLDRLAKSWRKPRGRNESIPVLWRDYIETTGAVSRTQSRPIRAYGNRLVLAVLRNGVKAISFAVLGSYNLKVWLPLGTLLLSDFNYGTLGIGSVSHSWVRVDAAVAQNATKGEMSASIVFSEQ